jgi:hypothetical protein
MAEPGTRPGGLTALAVINFIFAAVELIMGVGAVTSPISMPALIAHIEQTAAAESQPEKREKLEKQLVDMRNANEKIQSHKGLVYLAGGAELLFGVVLILSGIGYLMLRKFLGRTLGIFYGAGSILWGAAALALLAPETGKSLGMMDLIGFVYPAVTLFALLGPFKHDFTRP